MTVNGLSRKRYTWEVQRSTTAEIWDGKHKENSLSCDYQCRKCTSLVQLMAVCCLMRFGKSFQLNHDSRFFPKDLFYHCLGFYAVSTLFQ